MKYEILDTVILNQDLPDLNLRKGDLGAIVQVHEPDAIDVEFVTASGQTGTLVTLQIEDVRPFTDADLSRIAASSSAAPGTGNYTEERRELYSGLELDDLVTELKRRRFTADPG